jgi:hypothetical protein
MTVRLHANVAFLLISLIALSCGEKSGSDKQSESQEQLASRSSEGNIDISTFLPSAELPGFKVTLSPRTVETFQVREMAGEITELLMRYGLEGAAAAKYLSEVGGAEFAVSLYSFADVRAAFGAYAEIRKLEFAYRDIGSQGFLHGGALLFFKDRFVARVAPVGIANDNSGAEQLGRMLSERIPGDTDFPAAVRLFPDDGRVRNSERYLPSGFLDYDFFSPTYTCLYHLGDSISTLFLTPRGATAEIIQYTELITNRGGKVVADSAMGVRVFFVDDDTRGRVIMISKGGRLAGVINTPDGPLGMALLDKLWAAILEIK